MGYDFSFSGSVLCGHEAKLCDELIRFGRSIDLDVVAVNLDLTGTIGGYDLLDFGDDCISNTPIKRQWRVTECVEGVMQLRASSVEAEVVQGIVFLHHYEEWIITWNVTQYGRLARYHIKRDPQGAVQHYKDLLPLLDRSRGCWRESILPALPVAYAYEDGCNIHVPWRSSDVEQAVQALRIVQAHCAADFQVADHDGVWTSGIGSWRNLVGAYTAIFEDCGGRPVHPDPNEILGSHTDATE